MRVSEAEVSGAGLEVQLAEDEEFLDLRLDRRAARSNCGGSARRSVTLASSALPMSFCWRAGSMAWRDDGRAVSAAVSIVGFRLGVAGAFVRLREEFEVDGILAPGEFPRLVGGESEDRAPAARSRFGTPRASPPALRGGAGTRRRRSRGGPS